MKDPLYLASRGGSGGQTAGDAITGRHLSNWAIASGAKQLRTDTTTRRIQENESADAGILADIYALLLDRLWGRAVDPNTGSTEPDEFEGSDNARGEAVYELSGLWGPIESWLGKYLVDVYVDKLAEAMQLTPPGAELVLDPTEITRIRTHPYGDSTEDDRWGGPLRVGSVRGKMVVVDIYKQPLGGSEAWRRKAVNPGRLWFHLQGRPLWYYARSSDLRDAEAFVSEVSRQVTASTHLAAEMWPLLIKGFALTAGFVGGFGATLAYRIATEIASIALDELGEEGVRAAAGEEGRSAGQILKDAGLQFLLNRVVDRAYHLGSYTPVAGKLGAAIDRSALALRHQVVALEQDEVVAAIRAGRERPASPEWKAKGYESEVEVTVDGQRHTYRRRPDGLYCRYSDPELCELELARAAQARAERSAENAETEAAGAEDKPVGPVAEPLGDDALSQRLRRLVPDADQLNRLLARASSKERLARWLKQHGSPDELEAALNRIWEAVPDAAQRARLMDEVERPGSLAKYLGREPNPAKLEETIAKTRASGVPAGLSQEEWAQIGERVRPTAREYGDDIRAQGSRATGVPEPKSDLDLAIVVDDARFNEILAARTELTPQRIEELRALGPDIDIEKVAFKDATKNAAERGAWYSIHYGKIARGELGLSKLADAIARDFGLTKVDLSVIRRGGLLDVKPYVDMP